MPAIIMKAEPGTDLSRIPWLEMRDDRGYVKPQLVTVDFEVWLTISRPVKPGELGKLGLGWKHASDYPFQSTT